MRPLSGLLLTWLCAGCSGLDARYVRADRLTYEAIAPEYQAYVTRDEGLSEDQRARRLRTLAAWAARLDEAQRTLGGEAP